MNVRLLRRLRNNLRLLRRLLLDRFRLWRRRGLCLDNLLWWWSSLLDKLRAWLMV